MPVTLHLSLQRQEIAGQARDDVGKNPGHLKSSRPPSRDLPFTPNQQVLPMATPPTFQRREIAHQVRDDVDKNPGHLKSSRPPSRDLLFLFNL